MAERNRKLMSINISQRGDGDAARFFHNFSLPMNGASEPASVTCAGLAMEALNGQLAFVGSDIRVVAYDIKKKEYVKLAANGE